MLLSGSLRQAACLGSHARPSPAPKALASPARRVVQRRPLPTIRPQAAETAEPETAPAPEPPVPTGPKVSSKWQQVLCVRTTLSSRTISRGAAQYYHQPYSSWLCVVLVNTHTGSCPATLPHNLTHTTPLAGGQGTPAIPERLRVQGALLKYLQKL